LVYTPVLGTGRVICGGSSPLLGTMNTIIITHEHAGKRIDKFLAGEFSSYTRGELIRRIKDGEAKVGGKKVKPSCELREGDVVEILFSEQERGLQLNGDVVLDVLYEDKNIIVINKPAGLQVHPGDKKENNTLANGLVARFPEITSVHDGSRDAELRPGIVHRLDKDTSGVIVVARTRESLAELKKIFKNRLAQKQYVAMVYGTLENKKGVIEKPIARASDYRKQVIAKKNTKTVVREAVTEYKVRKEFGGYSLVDVYPKTGRMHQIRVHMASIGHPVVGDVKYAPKEMIENTAVLVSRQLLHASAIEFELLGKKYSFESATPGDFEAFVRSIDENQQS
jgi:23S rRNA pseudouridine1911/1915/1917 synthase